MFYHYFNIITYILLQSYIIYLLCSPLYHNIKKVNITIIPMFILCGLSYNCHIIYSIIYAISALLNLYIINVRKLHPPIRDVEKYGIFAKKMI